MRYFSSSHYLGFPVCCFAVFLWNVLSSPSLFLFDLYFLFVEVISLSEFVSTGFSFLLQPLIRFDAYSFRVQWPSRIGVGHFGSLNSGMTWIQWRLAPIKLFNALAILNRLTVTIQLESASNRLARVGMNLVEPIDTTSIIPPAVIITIIVGYYYYYHCYLVALITEIPCAVYVVQLFVPWQMKCLRVLYFSLRAFWQWNRSLRCIFDISETSHCSE